MKINNHFDLTKALTLDDLAPLSSRIKELETLFSRLADINKQMIEQQLQIVSPKKLSKEAYKVSEVASLTGMSKSVIRQKINSGEISKMASSTIGLMLIPKSEVERLTECKNSTSTSREENDKILKALSENKIMGISLSKKRIKKIQK
jgi:excisionase family DNA binding protein